MATTIEVLTDSIWSLLPPVMLGLPSGPFNLAPDSLYTLGYTATTLAVVDTRADSTTRRWR